MILLRPPVLGANKMRLGCEVRLLSMYFRRSATIHVSEELGFAATVQGAHVHTHASVSHSYMHLPTYPTVPASALHTYIHETIYCCRSGTTLHKAQFMPVLSKLGYPTAPQSYLEAGNRQLS